ILYFFFQAEDGIRDFHVTGVQTCALPICQHEIADPLLQRQAHLRDVGFAARPRSRQRIAARERDAETEVPPRRDLALEPGGELEPVQLVGEVLRACVATQRAMAEPEPAARAFADEAELAVATAAVHDLVAESRARQQRVRQ